MGKIQDAQAEVARIEAEIESLRQAARDRRRELGKIHNSLDGDDIARAGGLRTAIDRIQHQLPIPGRAPADWMPPLQVAHYRAKRELAALRRRRHSLAQDVQKAKARAARLARLPEVIEALDVLAEVGRESALWPRGLDAEAIQRARTWAEHERDQARMLEGWRAVLVQYGDDPHYTPPST